MRRSLCLLLSAALVSPLLACATINPHTELPPAPTDGSFEERRDYFKAHSLDDKTADHVFLHGGTRVYYPEDLLPAVGADSPTAKAIEEHLAARAVIEAWEPLFRIVEITAITGGVITLAGLSGFFLSTFDPSLSDVGAYVVLGGTIGGLGLMVAALGVMLGWNLVYDEEVKAAGETADRTWRTYPQSLTDNVDVGVNADGILFDLRVSNVFGVGGLGVSGDAPAPEPAPAPDGDDPADAPPPPPPLDE